MDIHEKFKDYFKAVRQKPIKLIAFLEKEGEINYLTFRRNIGERFPGASQALSEVRKCEISDLRGTKITYDEVVLTWEYLSKKYKTNLNR